MFNKVELISFSIAIVAMGAALFLLRLEGNTAVSVTAEVEQRAGAGIVFVGTGGNVTDNRTNAFLQASTANGKLQDMVIDDITVGDGVVVAEGDTVSVHYVGTLQNGYEFDSSRKRGTPFEFTVGEGQVIKGWEDGILGMKVGGQRILVIPPEMAYGKEGIGPIPPNATLVFAIELLAVK